MTKPLKDIEDEVVSGVEPATARVIVVPLLVVHGNPHLWRITVIQAVTTLEVVLTPEILGIVDVRIVVKAIPITEIGLTTPSTTIGPLVSRNGVRQSDVTAGQYGGDQKMTKHHCVPPRDVRYRHVRGEYRGNIWLIPGPLADTLSLQRFGTGCRIAVFEVHKSAILRLKQDVIRF